jgi:hypothetical protein
MENNLSNRVVDPCDLENRQEVPAPTEIDHVQARRARMERHNRVLRRLPTEQMAANHKAQKGGAE